MVKNFKTNINCPKGTQIKFKNINEIGCKKIKDKLLECDEESSCSINESLDGCDMFSLSMNYACVNQNETDLVVDEEMSASLNSSMSANLIQDSVNKQKMEINSSQIIENFEDGSEVSNLDEVNLIKNQQEEGSVISDEEDQQLEEQSEEQSIVINPTVLKDDVTKNIKGPFNFLERSTGSKWFWVVLGVILTAIFIGIIVFIINKGDDGNDFSDLDNEIDIDSNSLYGGNTTKLSLNIDPITENITETDLSFLK